MRRQQNQLFLARLPIALYISACKNASAQGELLSLQVWSDHSDLVYITDPTSICNADAGRAGPDKWCPPPCDPPVNSDLQN